MDGESIETTGPQTRDIAFAELADAFGQRTAEAEFPPGYLAALADELRDDPSRDGVNL